MKKPVVRKLRCAVYTRKSSEEGLEQEFNCLDAQREACEAYIASQRSEGWVLVPDRYDDGGVSGGTLERPALKRLLADIEARPGRRRGGLQDRPAQPLADGLLQAGRGVRPQRASPSSRVTQSFNTTTSMGRLTLNILLSLRPVRARGHRRAHPRQVRRLPHARACGWAASCRSATT